MVRVTIDTVNGVPRRVRSRGHAVRQGGHDSAPCAAVSALLKGLGLAVAHNEDCAVRVDAPRPGEFDLTVDGCRDTAWFHGVWDLARRSFDEIAAAWPDEVTVTTIEERKNGT